MDDPWRNGAICRGIFALGTACGHCKKCREQIAQREAQQRVDAALNTPTLSHRKIRELEAAIERLTAEKAAAEAEVKRMREAIRPFVEYVHDDTRKGDHRYKLVRTVELGGGWIAAEDLRRARAALKETSHDQD